MNINIHPFCHGYPSSIPVFQDSNLPKIFKRYPMAANMENSAPAPDGFF